MRIEANSSGGILKGIDGGVITTLVRTYGDSYFNGGNIGIGTASPTAKLHVKLGGVGDDSISLVEANGSATYGVYIKSVYAEEMGRVGALSQADGGLDGASIAFKDYGRDIVFNTHEGASNSEKVRIKKDGNVGIGTSVPSYALDVRDDSNILLQLASTTASNNARMVFAPNNTAIFNVGVDVSSSAFTWYDVQTATSPIKIEQGAATNSLVLKSDGKLGIGTGSANAPLHVKSSIDYITRFESTDTTAGIVLQDSSSSSRVTNTGGNLILSADINNEASNSAIRFMLDTSSNAGTDAAMVLKSTGLGIGIPSPNSGSKLHIRGTDGASGASTNVAANEVFIENNGNVGITLGTPNTGTGYYAFADSDIALRAGIFYDHSTDDMGFRVASSTAMTIDSNRNVGIGTSSPSATLEVATTATTDIDVAHFSNSNGAVKAKFSLSPHTGAGELTLFDGFNNADVFISARTDSYFNSGNVGIGTVSPSAKLHIDTGGDEGIRMQRTGTNANFAAIEFRNSDDTATNSKIGWNSNELRLEATSTYRVVTNSSDALLIDSSGNVGIGTASPARNLHVHASNFTDLHLTNDTTGATASDGTSFTAINSDIYLTNREAGNMVFQTSGSERARFLSGGAFLIGKTALGVNNTGLQFNGGLLAVTKDGGEPLILNRKTTDGVVVDFRKDNTSVGRTVSFAGDLIIQTGITGLRFNDANDAIHPVIANGTVSDGATDLGLSNARFKDIYATNGTIQTSDINEKQDIEDISEAETRVAVAAKGLLKKYRWKSAVADKGDDARIHFGIMAQDLQQAFSAEGLDAGDYGMFISSTWTDETTGEEKTRLGVRYNELLAFIIAAI
jgi:hypothetical protein